MRIVFGRLKIWRNAWLETPRSMIMMTMMYDKEVDKDHDKLDEDVVDDEDDI